MKIIFTLLVAYAFWLSSQAQHDVQHLEGVWKIEGKQLFEDWKIMDNGDLHGEAYELVGGEKIVKEHLAIVSDSGNVMYQATVADQNDGRTISFILNKDFKDRLRFENFSHDFPNVIIYQFLDIDRVHVKVMGSESEGFAFNMDRQ
ncbi:MAG: hypothetical protein R3345_02580 [Fulvivirga sp.]|nr:hypothetical protein [Fulvivirga sp.]